MECIKCKREMKEDQRAYTQDFSRGKKYEKTIYHCVECDIWIAVEVSVKPEISNLA